MAYSQECLGIMQVLRNHGIAINEPSVGAVNGGTPCVTHVCNSLHYAPGTGAKGRAVDLTGPSLAAIFDFLLSLGPEHFEELIWDNPHAQNRNVKNGKLVPIYDKAANASTHIHAAVYLGTFLDRLNPPAPMPIPPPVIEIIGILEGVTVNAITKRLTLDSNGNGSQEFPEVPHGKFLSFRANASGKYEEDKLLPRLFESNVDGHTHIEAVGGQPNGAIDVEVRYLTA